MSNLFACESELRKTILKNFLRSLFGILRRTNYFHFLPYMFENYCFFFKTGFKFIPEFRLIGIKGLEKLRYFLSKRMRVSLESVKITFIIFYSSSLCYFSIPKVLSRCVPRLKKTAAQNIALSFAYNLISPFFDFSNFYIEVIIA